MGSPTAPPDLTLRDRGQSQGHPHFKHLISRKGAKSGHMVPLPIYRKPYMASPITP